MISRLRKTLKRLIPSIIAGGADNDPAGIATYSISGAQYGYHQLWLLVLSTPMLIAVQAMCARLGDVKRKGLMLIIREHYCPAVAYVVVGTLIVANLTTLGADLAGVSEVIGMITRTSYVWWVVPIAVLIWAIVVFKSFRLIERYLLLLSFVYLAYVVSGFLSRPVWTDVLKAIIWPHIEFSMGYLFGGCRTFGNHYYAVFIFLAIQTGS